MRYSDNRESTLDGLLKRLTPTNAEKYTLGLKKLIKLFSSSEFLEVGEKMPDFQLLNYDESWKSLKDYLSESNLLISFYRGAWCPFCNLEIQQYQNLIEEFEKANTRIIAISPQVPEYQLVFKESNRIKIDVLTDFENKYAHQCKLTFEPPQELNDACQELELDYKEYNVEKSKYLPIPATYLVNRRGIIKYAYTNPDYTKRADALDVLNVAKSLL